MTGLIKQLIIGLLFLPVSRITVAQEIFSAQKMEISFYSSAPIEDIQAKTIQGSSTINPTTGAVYFKIPVHTFQFENSLMQSHFNSDYMETKKYPDALFKGNIQEAIAYGKDGQYEVHVAGKLTIHGVTRDYTGPVTLMVSGGQLQAHTHFKVRLEDYKIDIPSLLTMNIAEVVEVKVMADYKTGSSR